MASKFDADPVKIHDLFEGRTTLYRIPEYQRPYSWEKSHIDQLWDDLYKAWDEAGDGGDDSYFLGTVILVDNDDYRLDILDGQQRITTLLIFYAVLRDFFNEELSGQLNTIERRLAKSSGNKSSKYRLRTNEKLQDEFKTTILSSVELDEKNNYTDAARFTKNALENKFDDSSEIQDFFDFIELGVEVIKIETSDLSYAIRLFQTVNTRGKDLTVSDLTKSYLLSLTKNDGQRKTVTETWKKLTSKFDDDYDRVDDLLSSYRLYCRETRAEKSVYEELKDHFDSSLQEGVTVVELARDIDKYAEYFSYIEEMDSREKYMLSNLKHTQYWKTILTTAKKEEFKEIGDLMVILVALYYSYWVAGHTSEKIKKPSYDLIKKIKKGGGIDKIRSKIKEKRDGDNIYQKVRDNLYSEVFNESWHKPLLLAIEYNMSVDKKTNEIQPGQDIHSEHILPKEHETAMEEEQYWHEKFSPEKAAKLRHTLGNLIPLEQEVHWTVQQKPFPRKTKHYMGNEDTWPAKNREATSFDLTRFVVEEYEDWTPESIIKNREYLVKRAADVMNFDENKLTRTT